MKRNQMLIIVLITHYKIDTTVNKISKVRRTRTIQGRCEQLVLLKLNQPQTKV